MPRSFGKWRDCAFISAHWCAILLDNHTKLELFFLPFFSQRGLIVGVVVVDVSLACRRASVVKRIVAFIDSIADGCNDCCRYCC
jgi:hypothetical protein